MGVLKPVLQATPWINSFALVEGKHKLGNLKFRICLELTNLNKAIVCEPYHFKTQKMLSILAEACVITVCDCRNGYWHQQLEEASSLLTTFHTEFVDSGIQWCHWELQCLVMFSSECLMNVWQAEASNHHCWWHHGCWVQVRPQWSWPSFTNLLQTAQKCNIKLNYDRLQYTMMSISWVQLHHKQLQAS